MLAKLAFGNMRKLLHDYAVYFLTLVLGVAVFYAFNTMSVQGDFLRGDVGETLSQVGQILDGLTVFLAVILGFLMVYANNFLMRRRKKELGLYQVLGMRTGQVNVVLALETLLVAAVSFGVGIALGVLVSQVLLFVTARMFATTVQHFSFFFSTDAFMLTLACFGVIFVVMMLFNWITLRRVRLIDLMSSARQNEKQFVRRLPLSIVLTAAGLVLMGVAYWRLIRDGFPMDNSMQGGFIITTIMVAVGTFVFFYGLAGTLTALLTHMRGFYWRDLHMFTTRQIASRVNTTALSMGVIALILFLAMTAMTTGMSICNTLNAMVEKGTPYSASISVLPTDPVADPIDLEAEAAKVGIDLSAVGSHATVRIAVIPSELEGATSTFQRISELTGETIPKGFEHAMVGEVVSLSDYNAARALLGMEPVSLADGQYLLLCNMDQVEPFVNGGLEKGFSVTVGDVTLTPARATVIDDASAVLQDNGLGANPGTFVVADDLAASLPTYQQVIDVMYAGPTEEGDAALKGLEERLSDSLGERSALTTVDTVTSVLADGTTTTGLISYMAIYIGFVLVIACAAILAIQQLSNASDSAGSYRTLSELGCSERLIFGSLRAQVAIAFALPLAVGLAHSLCAISVLNELVSAFGYSDALDGMTLGLVLFALVYGGYLALTYRMAHGIVRSAVRTTRRAL
ncbi:ABC transporter permease [Olsenella sp. AM05-17]|jgi:putative ABC transport system permease protein|uniref:FtsX-like permease family protein n=1 Tax=unclassified Olsenella TaxID=2638792 RepID=UPI000E546FF3|nr:MULTISPECIES: ABC transporter permease [unclassified Olsenella]RHJ95702.1 ABC transporter permease [Olsenella sp. AM05-7]RHJ99249.1 ABC transporter permease [Olsenella sp. AM05-17]